MIPLGLFIFTFAAVAHAGLYYRPYQSYTRSMTKSSENGAKNTTLDTADQLNVSLAFDNMKFTRLPDGFVRSEFLTHLSLDGSQIESISYLAFEFVPRLSHLNLANNLLQSIDLGQFSILKSLKTLNLNGNCRMKQETTITREPSRLPHSWMDFYEENFTHEYTDAEPNSSEPMITVTPIPCVINLSAHLPNLTKLYLENNNLEELQFYEGIELPLLTHLYLSDNQLKIQSHMLSKLNELAPSLLYISLENSEIDQFDASQLPALTTLYLDRNSIRCVCNEYCELLALKLKAAKNLETLSVSRNKITKIEADSFNFTTNLVTLNLSYNAISEIREGTFDKLHLLRFLDLEFNHIMKLNAVHSFKGLGKLESLSLGHNNLLNITAGAFENLTALKKLALNQNRISSIDSGIFSKLSSLEELSLAGNHLSKIPDGCMPASGSLITLNLSNNMFYDTKNISLTNSRNLLFLYLKDNPLAAMSLHWYSSVSSNLTIFLGTTCPGDESTRDLDDGDQWATGFESQQS